MKIRTINRCIGDGFKNVFRNGLMSIASIGTITASLIILGIVFCLVLNVQHFAGTLDDNLGMVAFLKTNVTEDEVATLQDQLAQRDDISSFRYVSADEAWETFKQEMLGGDEINEALMEELDEDNPLANSSNFEIYPASPDVQDAIVTFLEASPIVRKVNYSASASQTLSSVARLVTYVGFALIGFLVFIAILLINNTIRISVYTRRNEISIMKYIGATNSFVRLPFLVEGILIGALGSILPAILMYVGYGSLLNLAADKFSAVTALFSFVPVDEAMRMLHPIFLGLSIVVGMFGSVTSVRKYLKA